MSATQQSPSPNVAISDKNGIVGSAWYRFFRAPFFDYMATNSLRVTEGANAAQGTATMTAGTVTVSNTRVTANSRIFLTIQQDGGTPGSVRVSSRVAGTSFTIKSTSNTDTSVVAYEIIEPA